MITRNTSPCAQTVTVEAYHSGQRVLIVHERRDGEIFYHLQDWNDTFAPFTSFRRMPESDFAQQLVDTGALPLDVRRLPSWGDGSLAPVVDAPLRDLETREVLCIYTDQKRTL